MENSVPPTPNDSQDQNPVPPATGESQDQKPLLVQNEGDGERKNVLGQKANRFFRIIKYFVLSCVILTIAEIWIAYWLISSRWNLLLTNEEMIEFAEKVKEAPRMPENFMRVYTGLFPNHVHTTLTQQVFVNYGSRFFFRHTEIDDKPHCMCDMIYDIQKKRHQELEEVEWDGRLQDLEFGFGIEKYATPEECFYYVMQFRIPELLGMLSDKHYGHLKKKPVAAMDDEELIELILLLKSRWHYNRQKNPARFEKALQHYRERLKHNLEIQAAKQQ